VEIGLVRTAWFVLMVSLLAGCASGPPRLEPNQTLERYLAYSGEPIDRFSSSRLNGWEPLARDKLVLRSGVNDAFLITVWDTCPDLLFANDIQVISVMEFTITRFDKVRVGRDTCPIREIRQIDVRQMRLDDAAIRRQQQAEKNP
jgi:hypothetical protein